MYNGQKSVLWINLRQAFFGDIKSMYQTLRSQGKLSYSLVESMFETHQAKWPEAIFNEDAYFKYLAPLEETGTELYLPMLQGSKAEQRKWWLYNRFRYLDSKYNAGDSQNDFITLRGYAKDDITIIPYADVYASVKYGSYLVQTRAVRNEEYTLICPLDNVNDTEIYIYSASQLKSVGDLSGLHVGQADFSMATKLQELKIGDGDSTYSNTDLKNLTLGNNVLLRTIDVRNCPNLVQAVDISGCSNVEEVYFDGTGITGLMLPNGGILKKLHLPETITNLTIRNQSGITEFVVPSFENVTTLRLENVSSAVDSLDILETIAASSRVRLIGIDWEFDTVAEIEAVYDILDSMRGLDENGNNMPTAQVSGRVYVPSIKGSELAELSARYPSITIAYDHAFNTVTFYDGSTLLLSLDVTHGSDAIYPGSTPTKAQTAQYTYSFSGWSLSDGGSADANALTNVTADRSVYAAFTSTVRKYTVTFVNNSSGSNVTLQTVSNVAYGSTASYTGSTPVSAVDASLEFLGWEPSPTNIVGNTTCYAQFESLFEDAEIPDTWDTIIANIESGAYKTAYKVGNYKPLDLGTEGTINMQIAAIDTDDLAGGGKAPTTWIGKELLAKTHRMNPARTGTSGAYDIGTGAIGGWENSEMRSYLKNTIKPLIPATVRNAIVEVSKQQPSYNTAGTKEIQSTTDDVWLPSYNELFGSSSAAGQPRYSALFPDYASRVKSKPGASASAWWLRSANFNPNFDHVNFSGHDYKNEANNSYGVALSFCLGNTKLIADDWDTILARSAAGTASQYYYVGQYKPIDLGTEGVINMQIAAFDTDDKADGNGKAGITWIGKELLATDHNMNATNTNSGGWEATEMRSYLKNTIKPLIPSNVRNTIVNVTKKSDLAMGSQTTTEDVWIPSYKEVLDSGEGAYYYSALFPDAASRKKHKAGSTSDTNWWLRSAYTNNSSQFRRVVIDGNGNTSFASSTSGVALSFCT